MVQAGGSERLDDLSGRSKTGGDVRIRGIDGVDVTDCSVFTLGFKKLSGTHPAQCSRTSR